MDDLNYGIVDRIQSGLNKELCPNHPETKALKSLMFVKSIVICQQCNILQTLNVCRLVCPLTAFS